MKSGNDILNVSANIGGSSEIDMGSGNDTINIGNDFKGNTDIDMGNDDDVIHMHNSIGNNAVINGSASIDFANGLDNLIIEDDMVFDFDNLKLDGSDNNQINNLEVILGVKGIDGTIIGPFDLSSSMGKPGKFHDPDVIDALLKYETISKIAKDILSYDPSQIEYYKVITQKMPATVLKKRGIIKGSSKAYEFSDELQSLTTSEARLLSSYCDQKLAEYLLHRGDKPFYHRKRASGYISGSVKYEVLKLAKSKCELCGVSNNDPKLECNDCGWRY